MGAYPNITVDLPAARKRALTRYTIAAIAAFAAFVGYFALDGRYLPAAIPVAALVIPLVVTNPRWALYQFAFILFVQLEVVGSVPLYLTDLSASLVILAAVFDVLMGDRLPSRLPRLSLNFLWLLVAVFLAGLFGYDPAASIRPLARITLLFITFLAIYRLAGRVGVRHLVSLFFWMCVLHSVIVLVGFVASSGTQRSFGLSPATFNSLAMVSFPVGLSLFIWGGKRYAVLYLTGLLLVFAALVSTQSRLSILFAVGFSLVVFFLSLRRARREDYRVSKASAAKAPGSAKRLVKRRAIAFVSIAFLLVAAVVVLFPGYFEALHVRFQRLWGFVPSETVRLRLVLWSFALAAFLDNPLMGIGSGCFRSIQHVLPWLRMNEVGYFVRGLSAHNLFLHYLAETGLVGAIALAALFINLYRLSRRIWNRANVSRQVGYALALYVTGLLFLVTTFLESGWLWGQTGFVFAYFAALIVRSEMSPEPERTRG